MKVILKEDLKILLNYDDRNTYDETSFKNLLAKYGKWVLTHENEYMKTIRDHSRRVINGN